MRRRRLVTVPHCRISSCLQGSYDRIVNALGSYTADSLACFYWSGSRRLSRLLTAANSAVFDCRGETGTKTTITTMKWLRLTFESSRTKIALRQSAIHRRACSERVSNETRFDLPFAQTTFGRVACKTIHNYTTSLFRVLHFREQISGDKNRSARLQPS